jgi:hypothetical protein
MNVGARYVESTGPMPFIRNGWSARSGKGSAARLVVAVGLVVALGACGGTAGDSGTRRHTGDYLPYADRIDLVVECLGERGFEASSYEGFGVAIPDDAQAELAQRAEGECWDEVEELFPSPTPLSLEEGYYYKLDIAECLRDLGYDIPPAPTLETYLDQAAAQSDLWDPYSVVAQRRDVDLWELQRDSCPPDWWAR